MKFEKDITISLKKQFSWLVHKWEKVRNKKVPFDPDKLDFSKRIPAGMDLSKAVNHLYKQIPKDDMDSDCPGCSTLPLVESADKSWKIDLYIIPGCSIIFNSPALCRQWMIILTFDQEGEAIILGMDEVTIRYEHY